MKYLSVFVLLASSFLFSCGGGNEETYNVGGGIADTPLSITRVSVDSSGNESVASDTDYPSISDDGRYVAFSSDARHLVPVDTNDTVDVFVHDRQTRQTIRVNVDASGNETIGGGIPSISDDGRYIAYLSHATDLVSGSTSTNGSDDIFIYDQQTGFTTQVSVNSSGIEGDSHSYFPSISGDGRYVAFMSLTTNLVPGDTNGSSDVFIHDRQTRQTTRVSVDSSGGEGNSFNNDKPSISSDGRHVAFSSAATNLVTGDMNIHSDVFVHDIQTGQTTRISVDSSGNESDGYSSNPSISSDGRFVAFNSSATNLAPGDTNGLWNDVFVHDRQTGQTTMVSVDSLGNGSIDTYSIKPSISNDGRYVSFTSTATNFVGGVTKTIWSEDVYIHDRQTGQTTRVSVDSPGNESDGYSNNSSISGDGQYIAFSSDATNLVADDTNGVKDIFVTLAH